MSSSLADIPNLSFTCKGLLEHEARIAAQAVTEMKKKMFRFIEWGNSTTLDTSGDKTNINVFDSDEDAYDYWENKVDKT